MKNQRFFRLGVVLVFAVGALLIQSSAFSQQLSLVRDNGSPVDTNDTLVYTGFASDFIIGADDLKISNAGPDGRTVLLKKEILSVIPGTSNNFCFGGLCYGGPVTVSSLAVNLQSGMSDSTFLADYFPSGQSGSAFIRYLFFDEAQQDTAKVVIEFRVEETLNVVAEEHTERLIISPNPGIGYFSFASTGGLLSVYDCTGKRIHNQFITPGNAIVTTVETENWAKGLYTIILQSPNGISYLEKWVAY